MNSAFCEMNHEEMVNVEGGNPVVVYGILAVGKYVVVPAAKIFAEAAVGAFIMKAATDLLD